MTAAPAFRPYPMASVELQPLLTLMTLFRHSWLRRSPGHGRVGWTPGPTAVRRETEWGPSIERHWISDLITMVRDWLESFLDPRTIRLLTLGALALLMSFLSGRIVSGFTLGGRPVEQIVARVFFGVGALLVLLAIGSGATRLPRRARDAPRGILESAPSVLGGQVVLGIELARRAIAFGVLSMKYVESGDEVGSPLRKVRVDELVDTRRRDLRPGSSPGEIYTELTHAVVEAVAALGERHGNGVTLSGVAITTPSWANLRAKMLESTIGPLPVNEALATGLARELWEHHRSLVKESFGTPESPILGEQDLADKIYLDEDARSVTRYDLHHRLTTDGMRRNYACVLVKEGIGAGLVLDGQLYYGSHHSEGEIGHTVIHLSDEFLPQGGAGRDIRVPACACQLDGLHWESVGGMPGLVLLAESLDKESFDRLTDCYGRPLSAKDLVDVARFARGEDQFPDIPQAARRLVSDDRSYHDFTARLLAEYTRVLVVGIGNLVNVLDLEHVVIGGPIISELKQLNIHGEFWSHWHRYVLRGSKVTHTFESLDQVWQGAALLFWDPAYRRAL